MVEPSNNISVFRRDTEWSSHVRINRSKGEQRKTRVIWLLLTLCLPFPHCFVNQMRFIDGDNAWMSLNTCLLFKRKLIYRNVIYLKGERDIYIWENYILFLLYYRFEYFFFSRVVLWIYRQLKRIWKMNIRNEGIIRIYAIISIGNFARSRTYIIKVFQRLFISIWIRNTGMQ